MAQKAKKVKRVDVPLRMIEGNIEALLKNPIPCNAIHFTLVEGENVPTLILHVHGAPEYRKAWAELGFQTVSAGTQEVEE